MIKIVTNQFSIYSDFETITIKESLDILNKLHEISLDSETTGLSPHSDKIICLQLGNNKIQLIIDNTIDLRIYKNLLESKLIIIQNAQFDLQFLFKYDIYPVNIWDTQIAEMILTTGLGDEGDKKDLKVYGLEYLATRSVSLATLAKKCCNKILDKNIRAVIGREGLTNRVIKYSAEDIEVLPIIKAKQMLLLEEFIHKYKSSWELVNLEMNAVKAFSRMLYNGFNIDVDKYKKTVLIKVLEEEERLLLELDDIIKEEKIDYIDIINSASKKKKKNMIIFQGNLFGIAKSNINWGSPEQKLGVLKRLNIPVNSTGAKIIAKYKDKHKIINKLLDYNKFKKLDESFGSSLLDKISKVTGRLHPSIKQILSTGRISMSNPNLAQIPSKGELGKLIRSCFIPRNSNYSIVGGDYSGMELRIIAEFSKDPLWVKTFKEGGDLHSILCCETFDISLEQVKDPFYANKDITYRDVQKTINFGLSYGMSKYKLADTIEVSVKEADVIIKKFFSKVPTVELFLNNLGELGKKRGYIKTAYPYRRVRLFPKKTALNKLEYCPDEFRWLGEIERAAKNTVPQGINGDIIKKALILTQEEIDRNNWDVFILLSVYDEIQTEAHNSIKEAWRDKLQTIMIQAAEEVIKNIPIVVDVKIDNHWCK